MKRRFFTALFILISGLCLTKAQITGTIYDKDEALQKFGNVLYSFRLDSHLLDSLLLNSGNNIMFKIKNENLYILNENRNPLYPNNFSVEPDEVFRIESVSKMNELLDKGKDPSTFFEERANAVTVTNGNFTLEEIPDCPPFCN